MRYTTIIDLSEWPALYRSESIRLVYLHLVLRSGYHDDDRDLIGTSYRRIARETGLTVGAVRHAVAQLERVSLITRQGPLWLIKKFVLERPITPRARNKKEERSQAADKVRQEEHDRRQKEEMQRQRMWHQAASQGKTPFMLWYESEVAKAEAGDPEAAQNVTAHRQAYEQHRTAATARQTSQS